MGFFKNALAQSSAISSGDYGKIYDLRREQFSENHENYDRKKADKLGISVEDYRAKQASEAGKSVEDWMASRYVSVMGRFANDREAWVADYAEQQAENKAQTMQNKQNRQEQKQEKLIKKNQKKAVHCPYCKSIDVGFMQQKRKGFSVNKSVVGSAIGGQDGALAGFAGKNGKQQWHCNTCGRVFETKK